MLEKGKIRDLKMSIETFTIDGTEYTTNTLGDGGLLIYKQLQFIKLRMLELGNQQAILNKAKNAYIADLNAEIVQGKSGINLSDLFSED